MDPDELCWQFAPMSNPKIYEKLHEVRIMVEPAAAELAANRRNIPDVDRLHNALDRMAHADRNAAIETGPQTPAPACSDYCRPALTMPATSTFPPTPRATTLGTTVAFRHMRIDRTYWE